MPQPPLPAAVIDISLDLATEAPHFPGDPPFSRSLAASHEAHGCEVAELRLSAHRGTHLDFPAHFLPHGRRQGDYAPADFVLPALVAAMPDVVAIGAAELDDCGLRPGEALLLQTENSRSAASRSGRFTPRFVSLTADGAAWLVEHGAALVGIDACSIEAPGKDAQEAGFPVHRTLLQAGVLILEGLHLPHVLPGRYTLVCAPLKLAAAEGMPARALLLQWA